MKKEFKRNPVFPALFLIPALLFGVTTLLQIATGNPVAFLTLIASVLFFINAFWQLSTPLIRIENGFILFKEALLKQRDIDVKDIQKVELYGKNRMDIYKKDNAVMKIRLDSMKSEDRKVFKKLLMDMITEDSSSL